MKKYLTGYRPVVHAREGLMLGIRQPLDWPVFETSEDATNEGGHPQQTVKGRASP